MPVETQHAAKSLKPERVRQSPQHLVWAELGNDVDADLARELDHAAEEPRGSSSAVQRELNETSTTLHGWLDPGTPGSWQGWRLAAASHIQFHGIFGAL